jgi:hypothetical protein
MRYLAFLVAALAAQGQGNLGRPIGADGTPPKATAAEYPAHATTGKLEIGAEYMVHSFSSGEQMYLAENYLVVEVALFPPKGEPIAADADKFALRLNGKKTLLYAQTPTMAASNLNRRDWDSSRGLSAGMGVGGIGIGTGNPPGRYPVPGSPDDRRRLPTPPRAPDADPPGGVEPKEQVRAEDVLLRTALPSDVRKGPIAGFLYFPYTGKTSGLKSIDLLYRDAVLKLK